MPPHAIPRYYGQPPVYARPAPRPGRSDTRGILALVAGILGLVLAFIGLPGLVLGPVAYFLGRSSARRIQDSKGELGGRSTAVAGWVLGVVATGVGALVTVGWLVFVLVAVFGPPPA